VLSDILSGSVSNLGSKLVIDFTVLKEFSLLPSAGVIIFLEMLNDAFLTIKTFSLVFSDFIFDLEVNYLTILTEAAPPEFCFTGVKFFKDI
jgi:hypothetical protein